MALVPQRKNITGALFAAEGFRSAGVSLPALKSMCPSGSGPFLCDEADKRVFFRVPLTEDTECRELAAAAAETFRLELGAELRVAYTPMQDSSEDGFLLSADRAAEALELAAEYFPHRTVVSDADLEEARLIESLSEEQCRDYVAMALAPGAGSVLNDPELLRTAEMLLRCDLNVSETARRLYIHRNTMLYRLDKLEEGLGLRIRTFEDALRFRLAYLMLKRLGGTQGEGGME